MRRAHFGSAAARIRVVAGVVLVAGATAITGLALGPAGAGAASRARPARSGRIGFSHAVVVDEQVAGFEPDITIDTKDVIYTSIPFGFSTTESPVWSSVDHGNSYLLVPGNVGRGKPTTCVGGGDSDLYVDPGNALYFSDLQALTNISNSVSTDGGATWLTNCAGAPNTPDDRMWFGGTGSLAKGNLVLYQDYDVVAGATAAGNNALVETVSTNGTVFQPVVNTGLGSDCVGIAVNDCVTGNEGISGNQVVDPKTGHVFIAHTTGGSAGVQVSEGTVNVATSTATWSESPNLDAALCPDKSCLDKSGNPEELAGENFATIAQDADGYLYVTFTAGPVNPSGNLTAAEQIYVVHSLQPAGSEKDPSKLTWSKPQRISGSGISRGTNTFPWITAAGHGGVDVAWYHSNLTHQGKAHGASSLTKAEWWVQMGQSLNAHSAHPRYRTAFVSEAPVKHGQICTNGLGCSTGGDRSLGDFLEVRTDPTGAALVSYVFDTSRDNAGGWNAGPEVISRQLSGPGLLGHSVSKGKGPGVPMGSVKDPSKDDFSSANGSRTPAGSNLDLIGASLHDPGQTLVAKIHVKSLSSLSASPAVEGPDASWLIRWTYVRPGKAGNGDVYYAGLDNNAAGSGTPSFFAGDTSSIPPPGNSASNALLLTYPQTFTLTKKQASYNAKTGVITLKIPFKDVGNPKPGKTLYSVTAFSATSTTPQSANTLFNQVDATPPFDVVMKKSSTTHHHHHHHRRQHHHVTTHRHHHKPSRRPRTRHRRRGFTG